VGIGEAVDAARHGDRQIIIGQQSTLVIRFRSEETYLVNAYVQVGRAISWINPRYVENDSNRLVAVDKAITAATTALNNVFGP
jgi:hypothetical protein